MIIRTWGGTVPIACADAFQHHLLATGVADYRRHGCADIQLWRRDSDGCAHFRVVSLWTSMEAIRDYAGDSPEAAVLYPGDEVFGLIPDTVVEHYDVCT
jgi:heme-degrading monooxygenase HmoA